MSKTTVMTLAKQIKTEADAYRYMENLRWPDGPVCPHCGSNDRHYFLTPRDGSESRKTRTGKPSERRVWKCKTCRKQFSVITGTVFHGTKVPLHTWLMVVFEMCANKNGIAAREIARKYGVAPKTAWFMTNRLREAMKNRAPERLMSGPGRGNRRRRGKRGRRHLVGLQPAIDPNDGCVNSHCCSFDGIGLVDRAVTDA